MHAQVLANDVRTLRPNAALDAGLLINSQKFGQLTRTAIATRGSTTNAVPSAAGP